MAKTPMFEGNGKSAKRNTTTWASPRLCIWTNSWQLHRCIIVDEDSFWRQHRAASHNLHRKRAAWDKCEKAACETRCASSHKVRTTKCSQHVWGEFVETWDDNNIRRVLVLFSIKLCSVEVDYCCVVSNWVAQENIFRGVRGNGATGAVSCSVAREGSSSAETKSPRKRRPSHWAAEASSGSDSSYRWGYWSAHPKGWCACLLLKFLKSLELYTSMYLYRGMRLETLILVQSLFLYQIRDHIPIVIGI